MADKITLDRETFKVLSADTRVDILKHLSQRKLTLTDLSQKMGMSPSTIKEHLDRLLEAELIEPIDRGTKWKYYRLTSKGRSIIGPNELNVWILLGTSLVVAAGALMSLSQKLGSIMSSPKVLSAPSGMGKAMASDTVQENTPMMYKALNDSVEAAGESAPALFGAVNDSASQLADGGVRAINRSLPPILDLGEYAGDAANAVNESLSHVGTHYSLPYLEFVLFALALVGVGYALATLYRKKPKI